MPADKLPLTIDISVDAYKSSAIEIPVWGRECMIKVPSVDNCTCMIEILAPDDATPAKLAADIDTDWGRAYSSDGNTDFLGLGLDPAFINVTRFLEGFPQGAFMRLVVTVEQTADRSFMAYFKSW